MQMRRGRIAITIAASIVVAGLFGIAIMNYYYRSEQEVGTLISEDVQILSDIFKKIHKECEILGFDRQQNPINFLNVVSFVGSEVGPMNLKYPSNWQGPYLQDNPTMQTKEYMIVRTKKGYFITPGNGVRLPNGKVIGKDVLFDENADIAELAKDALVTFKKRLLVQKLNLN